MLRYGPDGTGAPLAACRQFVSPACSPEDDAPDKWNYHPHTAGAQVYGIEGKCSGDFIGGSIVDHVVLPKGLPAGDYVLGFRWDCEQSAQVCRSHIINQNGATGFEMCFAPSTFDCRRTRLESSIKKFNPHLMYAGQFLGWKMCIAVV